MTFGEFIKNKREKMGKSQKEIAKALGVHPSTICLWEKGKGTPRPDEHLKIAKFYRMIQDEIVLYLNSPVVLGSVELDEQLLARKERTIRIIEAASDYKEPYNNIDKAVQRAVAKMFDAGWAVVSAQTAMAMYHNERGFFERTVQWCTTIVFER